MRGRLSLEVFMGQIFSPIFNPPRKIGSKSIPPQIKILMEHPFQIHIKVGTVFTCIVIKDQQSLQLMLQIWHIFLNRCCIFLEYNLASMLLISCFMKFWYLSYRFKLMTFPKSKLIHNIFTNCAPFPSISTPYPFLYGFSLH